MRRPSLIVGTAVLASVLSALLVPTAARAVDADQSLVVSATPSGWTPQVLDGEVDAIAAVGTDIVIGGTFTQIQNAGGGTTYARTNIAAFDATTGLVDPGFAPTLDGSVAALDSFGGNVVVGGSFATVDGFKQRGITELTLAGARVTTFAADLTATNKVVNSLVVRGGRLFIGGKFEKVNNVSRGSLAVLNPATGALDAFNLPVAGTLAAGAPPSVSALDVSPDGSTLVVGGNFTTVGGLPRTQLAIIDATAGKLTPWQTTRLTASCSELGVSTYVRDLSIAPDGSYFVMVNGGGAQVGTLCDSASRWELGRITPAQQPTWVDATGGDTLTSVATTGTAVYVGGHQRWVNNYFGVNTNGPSSVDRSMIAALDPVTGLPLSWDPGVGRTGTGLYDLLATPAGLWVGGDTTDKPFGTGHQRLAFFPVAGGTTVPAVQPQTLPRNLFTTTASNSLLKRSYNGSVFGATSSVPSPGAVAWGSVTGAFMLSGSVYYGTSDGVLHKASFDGTTVGAPSTVSTFWSTSPQPAGTGHSLADVTSFTIGSGRLYYVTGDGKLYYRWFSNESDVVGSEEVTAAGSGYTDAHEMFVASGNLYFAKADGKLYRIALSPVSGAPTGAAVAVSGTGIDANTWNDKAAFLSSSAIKPFVRLYGSDRVATSLAVSQDQFTAGSAGAVVLARSDAFPDGLAGAPLAYRTHAPVLLTAPTALDSRVSSGDQAHPAARRHGVRARRHRLDQHRDRHKHQGARLRDGPTGRDRPGRHVHRHRPEGPHPVRRRHEGPGRHRAGLPGRARRRCGGGRRERRGAAGQRRVDAHVGRDLPDRAPGPAGLGRGGQGRGGREGVRPDAAGRPHPDRGGPHGDGDAARPGVLPGPDRRGSGQRGQLPGRAVRRAVRRRQGRADPAHLAGAAGTEGGRLPDAARRDDRRRARAGRPAAGERPDDGAGCIQHQLRRPQTEGGGRGNGRRHRR